jgi:predicted alpha/beta superfamily hydrolase
MYVCALAGYARAAATLAGQAAPGAPVAPDTRRYASGEQEVLLAVTHAQVPSKVLHVTRDVSIWVPDAAPSGTRYPVLIFPDAEEKVQFRSALANVQFLINRGIIPPIMVVGVPYYANRRHELTPQATGETARNYPRAGGADSTMQFIADELLPWVDARYPTLPIRLLAGHSLGGLFALYTMVTRPDVFRIVIAMSPYLAWNDGAISAQVAASLVADTVHPRTLFLTSGGHEAFIDEPTTAFATRLTALLASTPTSRLRFERRRYERDIHEMTPLSGLIDGLRMAFEPVLVPVDSVVDALTTRHVQDPTEIQLAAEELQSRYMAGARSLGLPAKFPESALDALGGYSLDAKQPQLAVTLLRANRDRYPQSSATHESLGEALVAAGDTSGAVTEFHAAIAIAKVALAKPTSVLVRAQARDVMAASVAQLHAMNKGDTQAAN